MVRLKHWWFNPKLLQKRLDTHTHTNTHTRTYTHKCFWRTIYNNTKRIYLSSITLTMTMTYDDRTHTQVCHMVSQKIKLHMPLFNNKHCFGLFQVALDRCMCVCVYVMCVRVLMCVRDMRMWDAFCVAVSVCVVGHMYVCLCIGVLWCLLNSIPICVRVCCVFVCVYQPHTLLRNWCWMRIVLWM